MNSQGWLRAFHGPATTDLYTDDALTEAITRANHRIRELVDAAHSVGIKVVQDQVANIAKDVAIIMLGRNMRFPEKLLPDVLVKGADYSEDQIAGAEAVRRAGGDVVLVQLEAGLSSSGLVDRILAGGLE